MPTGSDDRSETVHVLSVGELQHHPQGNAKLKTFTVWIHVLNKFLWKRFVSYS